MRIFNFNISVCRMKLFVLFGTVLSCLFYFCSSVWDFKTYVFGIWSLIALAVSAAAIWLFKRSMNRKNVGRLRFLYDLGFACVNLLLLDEYLGLAFRRMYSDDSLGYAVKASAVLIIGFMFLGIAYLMTHREFMKKVWN